MSFLNTNWVVDNFKNNDFTFFEIGLAGIVQSVSYKLKEAIPSGKFYTFEAAKYWHEHNIEVAKNIGIEYIQCAVCDTDGEILFYPSLTQNGEPHLWSSSIFQLDMTPGSNTFNKLYGEPYLVKSIKLETFCKEFNITPDFIHIDVEGAEFKVFKNMGEYKPKCIWAEVGAFKHYDTKTNFEEFNSYLESIGYYLVFIDSNNPNDALYCLNEFKITNYK
jgi:FkbM family methyltransferase